MSSKTYMEAFEALLRGQGFMVSRLFNLNDAANPCVEWGISGHGLSWIQAVNLNHLPPLSAMLATIDN